MHPNKEEFDSIYNSKDFIESTMESFIRQVQEKYDDLTGELTPDYVQGFNALLGFDTLLENLNSGAEGTMIQNYCHTGQKYVVQLVAQYAPRYVPNLTDASIPLTDEERNAVSTVLVKSASTKEKIRLRAFIEKPKLESLHEIIPLRQGIDAASFSLTRYYANESNVALWTGVILGLYMNGDISSNEGTSLLLQLKAHGADGSYFDEACKYILRSERKKGD